MKNIMHKFMISYKDKNRQKIEDKYDIKQKKKIKIAQINKSK